MNIFLLIPFLSILVCIVIANIIYHKNKQSLPNRLFVLFSLLVAYWVFTQEFMCRQAGDLKTAWFWSKMGSLWIFSVPLFVHFSLAFTDKNQWLKKRWLYIVMYLPALFFSWLQLTTDLLGKLGKKSWGYSMYNLQANPRIYQMFFLWTLLMVLISIVLLSRYYFKTSDRIKKNQIKYVFIGVSIAGLLGITEMLFVVLGMQIPELSSVEITVLNLFVGYGVWKYQLFVLDPSTAAGNIIATMPDSLLLIDLEGKIVRANPSLVNLSKYQETEIVGKGMNALFKAKEFAEALQAELSKGNPVTNHEAELENALGAIVPVLVSGSPVKDKKGKVVGTVYIIRDITERKRNEAILQNYAEKLKQSNHDLQEFVYIASHDLQEPLRKIMMFGDRLQEKSDNLNNQERDYLSRMQHAAERMRSLITDLLIYSRVAFNKQTPVFNDLGLIMREIITDFHAELEQTHGAIISEELPVIEADPIQIRQLFQHLISNALKYRHPERPPQIKISARIFKNQRHDFAEICVADNGIGIEPVNFERVFGIFQRLHSQEEYGGTGIGLAVCKKIVENHQGTIRADGAPGVGAQFLITLPLNQEVYTNMHSDEY